MLFINIPKTTLLFSLFRALSIFTCVSLISACSIMGGAGSSSKTADAPKMDGVEQPSEQIPAVIPKENPYLSNPPAFSDEDRALFAQALTAANADQLDKARSLFVMLTQQNPSLSGPYLNLGVIAKKQGQMDEAEVRFKKAIEVNRNNLDAYAALALLYKDQAKFAEAKEQLTQAITIWPLYPTGHRNLGILNEFYLGDFKSALEHYKTYQSLLEKPDRKIKGWIIDLERRIPKDPEPEPQTEGEPTAQDSSDVGESNAQAENNSDESNAESQVNQGASEEVIDNAEAQEEPVSLEEQEDL